MNTAELGKKLRDLRGDRPQKDVAEAIGVTTMTISQYERGERIPRDDIKVALAAYFGRPVGEIFFDEKVIT